VEINSLRKTAMWLITIKSKRRLSCNDRDFLVELISEEARKTTVEYNFILHNVLESKKYLKILIEGTKIALNNLLTVCNDNTTYDISYKKYGK